MKMPNSSYELSSSVKRVKPHPPSPPQHQQEHHHQVDLEEDILFEIFLRLPLKSMCKFRCVSKSCLSLFTNPSFMSSFFDKLSCGGSIPWTLVNRYSLDFLDGEFDETIDDPSFFSTSSTQLHHELIKSSHPGFSFEFVLDSYVPIEDEFGSLEDINPLASSSGLVLCSSSSDDYGGPKDYLICNPFTRQFVPLPLPTPSIETKGLNGFLYGSSTGIYKVIHISDSSVSRSFNLQMFSSDTSEWSTQQVSCSQEMHVNEYLPRKVGHDPFRATLHLDIVNHSGGTWYWMDGRGDRMIAYNHNGGSAGECRLLDLPEGSSKVKFEQQCLGESKGLLYYGQIEKVGEVSNVGVWVFQDGYHSNTSSWQFVCKDIKIEDPTYITPPSSNEKEYSFIAFNPVDPNVMIMECSHGYEKYEVAYNIKTRKCEVLLSSHVRPDGYYCRADDRIVVTLQPTIIPTMTS